MANLKRAYRQLFARPDDERFSSFSELYDFCKLQKEESEVHWRNPSNVIPTNLAGDVGLKLTGDRNYNFNDWSFGQACQLAEVKKETVNRLQPETAAQVLRETMPSSEKPFQVMTRNGSLRSIHGVSYTRLFDVDLLDIVRDIAPDFGPPPKGFNGATGLYAGEQDMFAFLIDDTAWVDIGGEQFAPGFFVWNSEVGRRTVGIETFWYQRICANHIVWDAVEVVTYSRKHTANVDDAIDEIHMILRRLVRNRDARRDGFANAVNKAMTTSLGSTAEDVTKALSGKGISMNLVKQAVEMMTGQGSRFSVFQAVDSLTRLSGKLANAGDRAEQDSKIGSLLALAV